jgi:DNA-binding GntR family transcriptional regulator
VEAFRRACESENFAEVVELDMAFHRLIVSMDPQDDLEVIWLPVIMQLSLPYSRHHKLMESYDEHHAIVEAIEQGQKAEAVRKLKRNIR